jgi:hypothetical protein
MNHELFPRTLTLMTDTSKSSRPASIAPNRGNVGVSILAEKTGDLRWSLLAARDPIAHPSNPEEAVLDCAHSPRH